MNKSTCLLIFAFLSLLVSGCVTKAPADKTPSSRLEELTPKVDGFFFIIDTSPSMFTDYKGRKKIDLARETVLRLNETMPAKKYKAGFQALTSPAAPYGMKEYNKLDFETALNSLTLTAPGGPMEKAMAAGMRQLGKLEGDRLVAIIVSDGDDVESVVQNTAEAWKVRFGPRFCMYIIQVGDSQAGRYALDKNFVSGKCGNLENADNLLGSEESRVTFVEKALMETGLDSDGDGVVDTLDRCPNTPKGAKVNKLGCSEDKRFISDSDGDGVVDMYDHCPESPAGSKVNDMGCPDKRQDFNTMMVEFPYGKTTISKTSEKQMKGFAEFMNKYPQARAVLEGHVDAIEAVKIKGDLALKRAKVIEKYLIEELKVNPEQLQIKGRGAKMPRGSNETGEGRKHNRRVETSVVVDVND